MERSCGPMNKNRREGAARIVQSEKDEFIQREHAEYLARAIPDASFILLHGVSHFAPLQRPEQFNMAMLEFVDEVLPAAAGKNG